MAIVTVLVATKQQPFASGTADAPFTYTLTDAAGAVLSQDTADLSSTFADVAPGDYTVTVTKLGFTATSAVTVPAPPADILLAVPDTISVTVG